MWGRRCCGAVGHDVGQVVLWVEMWGRQCCGAVGHNVGQAVLWGCGSRCGAGGAVGRDVGQALLWARGCDVGQALTPIPPPQLCRASWLVPPTGRGAGS